MYSVFGLHSCSCLCWMFWSAFVDLLVSIRRFVGMYLFFGLHSSIFWSVFILICVCFLYVFIDFAPIFFCMLSVFFVFVVCIRHFLVYMRFFVCICFLYVFADLFPYLFVRICSFLYSTFVMYSCF